MYGQTTLCFFYKKSSSPQNLQRKIKIKKLFLKKISSSEPWFLINWFLIKKISVYFLAKFQEVLNKWRRVLYFRRFFLTLFIQRFLFSVFSWGSHSAEQPQQNSQNATAKHFKQHQQQQQTDKLSHHHIRYTFQTKIMNLIR